MMRRIGFQLRPGRSRVKARHRTVVALVPLVTALGCGSGDSNKANDTNDAASKSAAEILNDTAAALKKVRSVRMEGTQTIDHRKTAVRADLEPPSKIRLTFDQAGAAASIIAAGGSVYIKANQAFWKNQGVGGAGSTLAGKWFKAPTSGSDFKDLTKQLDVATLSRCLVKDHGTISKGGAATVNGEAAVVLLDKGDRPGSAPGKLFVAAKGDPLPLRIVATGEERPGGTKDPLCNDSGSRTHRGDTLTLSRYNESLEIAPPEGALDFAKPGQTTR
jgi:outer membrane lipoprotein-sorting protein